MTQPAVQLHSRSHWRTAVWPSHSQFNVIFFFVVVVECAFGVRKGEEWGALLFLGYCGIIMYWLLTLYFVLHVPFDGIIIISLSLVIRSSGHIEHFVATCLGNWSKPSPVPLHFNVYFQHMEFIIFVPKMCGLYRRICTSNMKEARECGNR